MSPFSISYPLLKNHFSNPKSFKFFFIFCLNTEMIQGSFIKEIFKYVLKYKS